MPGRGPAARCSRPPASTAGEEVGDQAEDEAVEDDRLGQREAEPLDARDLVTHLGLAGDRLDHLAEDVADAHAGADRAEPCADAERDRLDRLRRLLAAAARAATAGGLGDDVRK